MESVIDSVELATFEVSVEAKAGVVDSVTRGAVVVVLAVEETKIGVVESVIKVSTVDIETLESITLEPSPNRFGVVESVTGAKVVAVDSFKSVLSVKISVGVVGSASKGSVVRLGSVDDFSVKTILGGGVVWTETEPFVELDSLPEVVDIVDSVVDDDMSLAFSVEIDSIVSESSFATVVDLIVVASEETGIALGDVDLSEVDDMDILVDLEVTVETVVNEEVSGSCSSSKYSGGSESNSPEGISFSSYGTFSILFTVSEQVKPSPVNPSRHEHWKLPKVFVHSA